MLAALLPIALQALQLWKTYASRPSADNIDAAADHPAVDLALKVVGLYKTTRDAALADGTVTATDPAVMTDAALIDAFEADAIHFRDHATALLAKYATPTP